MKKLSHIIEELVCFLVAGGILAAMAWMVLKIF